MMETYAEHVAAIDHYVAIGQGRVSLGHNPGTEAPWELTTSVRTGGSHRLDMETTLQFEYDHPSGVKFSWWIDVEERSANGTGSYQFEVARLVQILEKVPAPIATQLREYLESAANTVQTNGDEYLDVARRQYGDAEVLRKIASYAPADTDDE